MDKTALVRPAAPVPVVRVHGFAKHYRKRVAVQGVDLEILPGELYGLIGPDGAGKSSLMKAVAGVLSFEAGEVEVFGVRIDSERAAERIKGRLGFMPQGLGQHLYPDLSVEENIDVFARLRLVPELALAERKQRLLEMTRLDRFRERPMKHLSGGMKQKLGLVCTLIHEPELLILDEPTTGVDPVSRQDFWTILARLLRERSLTALISTAYMDEAARFHRAALLCDGQVLAQGAPDTIRGLVPASLVVLRAEPQLKAVDQLTRHFAQVGTVETRGEWIRVLVNETDASAAVRAVEQLLSDAQVSDVQATSPELEDVFVALLRRQQTPHAAADTNGVSSFQTLDQDEVTVGEGPRVPEGPEGAQIAIEAVDLVRDFDGFRAVDGVSFRIHQGEIFGLVGANGAGKTTAIKMLTGILPPTAGTGRVAGADMRRARRALKERIGYMSQAFSLYLDLSVVENIHLFAGIYGLNRRATQARTNWIVGMAELEGYESSLAGQLPLGVRQRLALGCALVHRPRVLFLDEPTSGVDPLGRRRFWNILLHLSRQEGVATLVTTHYMNEAEHCDQLALMHAGHVVANASPAVLKQEVKAQAGTMLDLVVDQPLPALELLEQAGLSVALFGTHLHVLSQQSEADGQRFRQILQDGRISLHTIQPRPLTLDNVFVHHIRALELRDQRAQQETRP